MKPSTELKDVMLRWYESLSAGDMVGVESLLSCQDGTLAIGTDPNEWWTDYKTFVQAHRAQFQETGRDLKFMAGELTAFAEGSVGWVADRPTLQLSDGQALPFRATAVFHQESEQWKLVQLHFSFSVPNSDAVGSNWKAAAI